MTPKLLLDYPAILANEAKPVHLVLQFNAPEVSSKRSAPLAFALVLDKSYSMQGDPIRIAKKAAQLVVRNLRKDDLLSVVTFDEQAQTVVPLQVLASRRAVLELIDQIEADGSTNLTAGWMLGRDNLKQANAGVMRRVLMLSDGQLNHGIVEPDQVHNIVVQGLERDQVRTSTLGFGAEYNEDLLSKLAQSTNGTFHDANSVDKLPGIFSAELDGLQKVSVQNLRARIKLLDFVERYVSLGGYPSTAMPDGRMEFNLGDLVSEEERIAVFALEILPIPLIAPGKAAASLDGEALVELEVLFDLISDIGVRSVTWQQTLRVRAVQDPADQTINEEVLCWVSAQQAAKVLEEGVALRARGDVAEAKRVIEAGIARLQAYKRIDKMADALQLLETFRNQMDVSDEQFRKISKSASYAAAAYKRMRSSQHWTIEASMPAPSFIKPTPPLAEVPPAGQAAKPADDVREA